MSLPIPGTLIGEVLRHLLGLEGLSWEAFVVVTSGLMILCPLAAAATPSFVDSIGHVLVLRRRSAVLWVPVAVLGTGLAFGLLAVSVVGPPIALLLALAVPIVAFYGYTGACLVVDDAIVRRIGGRVHPVGAVALGLLVLRTIRLVPYLGGIVHGAAVLAGFAAATLVLAGFARSWWRRRMPDDQQFAGERTIEWRDAGDHNGE